MKRFAFFWPALVLLLVPLLLVGMVAHTYMTASLPFLSLYNADSAFDHIEVKGSLRNDTYGYQMDFQVRSGETSAVNRFYYHAPAGMPFSDEYKPEGFRGMSWQIWIPQDAQAKLITSDQPGISEVVISGGSSGSEEKWISYIEEWECTAVEAQLYY